MPAPSGGAVDEAALLHPADFWEPVADRDCRVELVVPPEPAAEQQGRATRVTRVTRKRQREEDEEEEQPRVVVVQAASQLLKAASQKFRASMERWAVGQDNRLRIECRDESDVELFRHLLDFVNSLGRTLPQDPQVLHGLLLLAREQGVEPCVAACLKALLGQVDQLDAPACLTLLRVLDTGVSEHSVVQAAADRLMLAALDRAASLLGDEGVRSDAGVQALLLELLGALEAVLNDSKLRRPLFSKLPFEVLRDCVLADGHVRCDAEVTILAAFCFWAESGQAGDNPRRDAAANVNAICSRIRLPDIPPALLQCYWAQFSFLRRFDPKGHILMRAVTAAAEPFLLSAWQELAEGTDSESDSDSEDEDRRDFTTTTFKAKCSCWWTPREPPLKNAWQPAMFEVEIEKPVEGDYTAVSINRYWGGCFWHVEVSKEEEQDAECVGAFVMPSVSMRRQAVDISTSKLLLYGTQVHYSFEVLGSGETASLDEEMATFWPTACFGWGLTSLGPVTWQDFWADGSPWLARDGVARVRFTLRPPA